MAAEIDERNAQIACYLGYLSERVRGLRAARGMTRKQLAQHSSISERYLAQLEGGKANPSIAVLWRIADAMGIDFGHLLHEPPEPPLAHGGAPPRNRRGLAVIGLRGAGKTTLGERLAASLTVPFLRLSEIIEERGGMEIGELFSLGGQKAYRRLERQALETLIDRDAPLVLEVGGSLVSEAVTYDLLRSAFVTVWLRARPEEHMERVVRQGDTRPMEGSAEAMADLYRILAEREADYRKADFVVDTSDRSVDECAQELRRIAADCLPAGGGCHGAPGT